MLYFFEIDYSRIIRNEKICMGIPWNVMIKVEKKNISWYYTVKKVASSLVPRLKRTLL